MAAFNFGEDGVARVPDRRTEETKTSPRNFQSATFPHASASRQVEKIEGKIAELDSKMMSCGSDYGKIAELEKEKNSEQAQLDALYREWEELEELLAA